MDKYYSSFIKFGEKKYMEKLFYEGIFFCKTIEYFSKIDNKDFRGDKIDGIEYIKQIRNLKISNKGNVLATAKKGQLYGRNPENKGNVYCLFGLANESLNWNIKTTQKLTINLECLDFADTAIWIYNPEEFMKRAKEAITKEEFIVDISPIIYLDYNTYEGKLSPFTKSNTYESQSEIRFWIPNKLDQDLTFKIGDISDISVIMSREMFDKLEYEIE